MPRFPNFALGYSTFYPKPFMIKKITYLFFFLFLPFGAVHAQITLLPKAGVTFTSYTFGRFPEQRVEETYEPGVVAGVALNIPVTRWPWLSV
ncbi:hypothetical protein EFA69_08730 [Rufibacter immobilis]|uniref:Uncharacterized protein n=1 Tax=Rufibacter immobilis TaxID=1348778 RepID=A0A3M9MXN3_9BACT|nr:hypothetical protein EFA69_08730 [Rufibacter immobilis]